MRYEIFENGKYINTIVSDDIFCLRYCENNGYTYKKIEQEQEPEPIEPIEPGPTDFEQLRADVDYIAMETGVEL